MTAYVFETMSASDAANFTSNDQLSFSSPVIEPSYIYVTSDTRTGLISVGSNNIGTRVFHDSAFLGSPITFTNIAGSAHPELFIGSFGDNTINITNDDDHNAVYGLAGNDLINDGNGGDDIFGGTGSDTIFGNGGDDKLFAVGDGIDTGQSADLLDGGAGNDLLWGGTGDDTLRGGTGNDVLIGSNSSGHSLMVGGPGNDIYHLNGTGAVIVENADEGIDEIDSAIAVYTMPANVERLNYVGTGDATFTGNAEANSITGGNGNDILYGGGGADSLSGGDGNDHLYGQSPNGGPDGADSISGGNGSDYLQGNAGNDTLDGGVGSDRINGGANDDLISGGTGNDTINGNLGNDTIDGGDGNDSLRGGQGNDSIVGGNGNDIISGDLGSDTLTGGAGADIFVFSGQSSLLANPDQITDYTVGTDHLSLGFTPAAVLTGAAQASLSAAASAAQALFDGHAGNQEVAVLAVGSDSYVFYSSSGGATVDSAILLSGVGTGAISASDFY
jgi:Ca2+-binding RTX toxin-like protein